MCSKWSTCLANRALMLLFYFQWRRYWARCKDVASVQQHYLLSLLTKNAPSQFGQKHGFSSIKNIDDFQRQVPVSSYEDYSADIHAIKNGEKSVLTTAPVTKFSLSSGTASASKLIPNTHTLIGEFDRCISVWLFDLYRRFPQLLNGKSFWIITPSSKAEEAECTVPTAFDNDSEYFSPAKQWFVKQLFAVPDEVARLLQGDAYYFVLAVFLVSEKNLRLISVWNPSVMLILLEKTEQFKSEIITTVRHGKLCPINSVTIENACAIERHLKPNPSRADELETLLCQQPTKTNWQSVWPHLTLISAWDSAWAKMPAQQLRSQFPGVAFQAKGLLATEACVTFPAYCSNKAYDFYPAFTSHFFEFENIATKQIKLLHQLETGQQYEVLVTTGGGFYRYRLNDRVTCTGHNKALPLLRFDGKSNHVCDLTGEKLNETHVAQVVHNVFGKHGISTTFHCLAPQTVGNAFRYALYLYAQTPFDANAVQAELELGLSENFHYAHSRRLGQLLPSTVVTLSAGEKDLLLKSMTGGKKAGTYKAQILQKEVDLL